jgi:hypothetical protein
MRILTSWTTACRYRAATLSRAILKKASSGGSTDGGVAAVTGPNAPRHLAEERSVDGMNFYHPTAPVPEAISPFGELLREIISHMKRIDEVVPARSPTCSAIRPCSMRWRVCGWRRKLPIVYEMPLGGCGRHRLRRGRCAIRATRAEAWCGQTRRRVAVICDEAAARLQSRAGSIQPS